MPRLNSRRFRSVVKIQRCGGNWLGHVPSIYLEVISVVQDKPRFPQLKSAVHFKNDPEFVRSSRHANREPADLQMKMLDDKFSWLLMWPRVLAAMPTNQCKVLLQKGDLKI